MTLPSMRRGLIALGATLFAAALALTAAIAFGTRRRPPPIARDPRLMAVRADAVLTPVSRYRARDGTQLAYRAYPGGAQRVAIVLHGSACDSSCMHGVSKSLGETGATVYALDLRGHGGSGTRGDVDYIGQLDDDVADFAMAMRQRHPGATFTLVGFSAGGALVIHVAGGPYGRLFDGFIVLAPALVYPGDIARADGGGWASVYLPRIVGLSVLGAVGIHAFDGLDAVAYAIPPERTDLTPTYSFRLAMSLMGRDYRTALRRTARPMALVVGAEDDQFHADRYGPALLPYKPDLAVTVVPGVRHMTLLLDPAGLAAIQRTFELLPQAQNGRAN